VSCLHRTLLILVLLRLLAPPGICLCKLTAPASDSLAGAIRGEPPPPLPNEPDDDHAPGCPASCLSQGMWVKPPVPALPPDLALAWLPTPDTLPSACPAPAEEVEGTALPPPDSPRFLTLCTLLL
jgi:hypothetical protein